MDGLVIDIEGDSEAAVALALLKVVMRAEGKDYGGADADYVDNLPAARELIDRLDLALYRTKLGSAHVMGGCAMSEDPRLGVCDSLGRHHQLENLSIHDGSLFPTSIGANPQLSIYALCAKLASALAERLRGA